jgi:UDP-glucuronate 4-epimerase
LKLLITGTAGFIGYHVARQLLARGDEVVGIDNLNNYYDVKLKRARLANLKDQKGFSFVEAGVEDRAALTTVFDTHAFSRVVHLAAQAGVRYSLENPAAYIDSNLVGFGNILECCRHNRVEHLVYASSSSVYGLNQSMPFSVHDNVDHPVSLYAATKKANELMAHSYAHLYSLPTTGLRFFTVYGPWGRPDMAYYLFTKAIHQGTPIKVYNNGQMMRDFTYIDDIVEGVVRTLDTLPQPDPAWDPTHPDPGSSPAPYRIYNIGNNQPVKLMDFIATIEKAMGKDAIKEYHPMQPGDVVATYADVKDLQDAVGFSPSTSLEDGIRKFVTWYRNYHK